ncbi:MAG: hypothetical protein KY410_10635 [Proteobacteria bacterium]|nr:hypothetical protein [Pseudomonadota bacterium]
MHYRRGESDAALERLRDAGGGFQAGVIAAAAIILYGLVFGLEAAERAVPASFVYGIMVSGVLIFAGFVERIRLMFGGTPAR